LSVFALTLVLTAALLHAFWNAIVKAADDRAMTLAAVSLIHVLVGVALIVTSPLPAPASWPSIVISTTVHYGYYALLFQAYRLGDLSQVYPISRGMAPALVALGAFLLIGESLSVFGWIGLFAVSCGIGFLALQRGVIKADPRAVWVAILLGLCIASYSVADGIGIRLAESPGGYIGWLFLGEAPVPLFLVWWRMRDGRTIEPKALTVGLLGGILAVGAYGIVLYAKTIAPLAAVSAIRESSVIFAALIGLIVFKERPWKGRLVSAAIVASGVITLAIAG
jgi:uncharacterized membrane protein